MSRRNTKIWGHRGFASKYPENTLPAFAAALELGVDGLEFDIHLSADGELVVIHDGTLNRTTNGDGTVANYTLRELKQFDAGRWFSPKFSGTTIPTLQEVLELVVAHPNPVQLNIEIKSQVPPYPGIARKAWERVGAYDLLDRTLFSSFNHLVLRDLKSDAPSARIGLLYEEAMIEPWRYAAFARADALHPHHRMLDEATVREAHRAGIAVNVYTVNDEQRFLQLAEWGVDVVISDVPDVLLHRLAH